VRGGRGPDRAQRVEKLARELRSRQRRTGSDPLHEFQAAAPWIANVHIKDLRLPGPRWLPAGEGIIDYRAHFQELRRIQYQGPVSLEPHMDGSADTIRRCKEALERLWEGEP
jgi:sugar phosphate isomerase/epimerase